MSSFPDREAGWNSKGWLCVNGQPVSMVTGWPRELTICRCWFVPSYLKHLEEAVSINTVSILGEGGPEDKLGRESFSAMYRARTMPPAPCFHDQAGPHL